MFTIDGTAQPEVALNGSGQATLTTSSLTAGTHTVTAAYGGDQNFGASTSPALTQVVSGSGRTTVTTIQSSLNPSQLGDAVTFTAAVAPTSGTGTPTGNVVFTIDGVAQPAVALSATGAAGLTLSSLSGGTHTVVAAYGGDTTFAASTSPVLNQLVGITLNSQSLREMQIMTTKIVAQTSGQSIQGAIDNAIDEGFSEGGPLITATDSSMRFNFAAVQKGTAENAAAGATDAAPGATAQSLDPLAFDQRAAAAGTDAKASKAIDASLGQQETHAMSSSGDGEAMGARWRPWVDVRYTDWNADEDQADVEGDQTNALVGLTYKLNPKLLIGVFGGYENFDYSSVPLNATMDGDGWTAGAYLGWLFAPAIRFDAGIAHSWIDYSGTAGTASGDFDGSRFLFTSSVTGTHPVGAFIVEPSAKIYVLWENDSAYTDSLGTLQPENDFSTGRASGGVKLSYPFTLDDGMKFVPYAGVYGDYYFSEDDATVPPHLRRRDRRRLVGAVRRRFLLRDAVGCERVPYRRGRRHRRRRRAACGRPRQSHRAVLSELLQALIGPA